MPFLAINTRRTKSRKIDIFPKRLTHGFGQKMAIFPTSFFRQYRPGKYPFRYSRTKKLLSISYKNKKFKQSKHSHFSQGVNPWFWSKKGPFTNFFFQAIKARKMSFTIFFKEKTPFYPIKTGSLKSQKIDIFPKGLTHGFGPKMAIFRT